MAWGGGNTNNVELWVKRLRDNDPSFTSLHILSFRRVTPAELGQVFEALQHNEHLKELYASGHALDPSSASALGESLKHNRALERLNIGHDHLGVDKTSVERVCQGLAQNKGLKRLDLENKGFGGQHGTIEMLAKALESPECQLQELVLARNKMTDDDVQLLCTSLAKNRHLQKLDLCLNAFGQAGTEAVARLLASQDDESTASDKGRLIEIDLSDNEITEQGGRAIGEALASNKVLRRLRMSSVMDPPVPVEEGEDDVLPMDQTLEELRQPLAEADLQAIKTEGDAVLAAIAASLKVNQTLQELWMDYCDLSPVGIEPLAEALRTNKSLTTLRLRNNRIGNRGARALGAALTGSNSSTASTTTEANFNSTLTALELGVNKIGQLGWQGLAGAGSLESLGLFGNTVHSLHEALENHPQQSYSAGNNTTEASGLVNGTSNSTAAAAGMALSRLVHLDVGCNEISREAFTSLGASLIKGMLPALIKLEIAGNGDRSEVEHGHGHGQHEEDFPESVREEEQAWARVVERIREARPELEIHWKVSNGLTGGREL